MCRFRHQHGEGKKWYFQARRYAEDLLSDLERRWYIEKLIYRISNGSGSGRESFGRSKGSSAR